MQITNGEERHCVQMLEQVAVSCDDHGHVLVVLDGSYYALEANSAIQLATAMIQGANKAKALSKRIEIVQ